MNVTNPDQPPEPLSAEIEDAIEQVLAGNREAYTVIVSAFERQIYAYCRLLLRNSAEAEDATQDILIKAYRGLSGYEKKASFASWLYKIAYYHCIDLIRSSKRRKRLTDAYRKQLRPESSQPRSPEQDRIDELFEGLTAEERNLLLLRALHRYTFEEIGRITGRKPASTRKQFGRLKKKLTERHLSQGGLPHANMEHPTST